MMNDMILPGLLTGAAAIWLLYKVYSYDRREAVINDVFLMRTRRACWKDTMIDGAWNGLYDYGRGVDSSAIQSDRAFTANFSLTTDQLFSGHIEDSLGTADVEGICEYPEVRFRKKYRLPTDVNPVSTGLLYRGNFDRDGTISGRWRVDDRNTRYATGSWTMHRNKG